MATSSYSTAEPALVPAQITILYFAAVRTSLPSQPYSQLVSLPSSPSPFPLSHLRQYLVDKVHPGNQEFKVALENSAWSVEEEMIPEGREAEQGVLLRGGETVCPIPPVSGG